jgi:Domain of unknown function (DUF4410)
MRDLRSSLTCCLIAALLATAATPALAKKKKNQGPPSPGVHTDWGGEIDHLEVLETFELGSFESIFVLPLDTSQTPLPEKDDNTYERVKSVLAGPTPSLVEGMQEGLADRKTAKPVRSGETSPGGAVLLIRGSVPQMDPGSQSARYWGGFGAGAARTTIKVEAVDAGSGKVLFRLEQERRSGVGMFGGDYEKLMHRNLRAIGEDLAMVLAAFD